MLGTKLAELIFARACDEKKGGGEEDEEAVWARGEISVRRWSQEVKSEMSRGRLYEKSFGGLSVRRTPALLRAEIKNV